MSDADTADIARFRDGFTRIKGQKYEAESGTQVRVDRQKLKHNFRGGYKPTGPKVPISRESGGCRVSIQGSGRMVW